MLKEYFHITVCEDKMKAEIDITENYENIREDLKEQELRQFLQAENIVFGIHEENILQLLSTPPADVFPLTIAEGRPEIDGVDGELKYVADFNSHIEHSPSRNFRDIMRIPSVNEGDKIAVIIEPTAGKPGENVYGKVIRARQGKPVLIKAGKNVQLNESDLTFYATAEGQISVTSRYIHVHSVYELNEAISMKVGNIDFVGSVVIRGDVPTGYTIKAKGDIKVFGMVEAATLIADGSIFVSEGLAGLKTGTLRAAENVYISYINQGNVAAGNSIHVENSILHSECIAKRAIHCQNGNIIGGSLSVGQSIEAKDVGTRMNTKTEIYFGINKAENEKEKKLLKTKAELEHTLTKLTTLGEKLQLNKAEQNSKLRITLLRQRHSYNKTASQIEKINQALKQMDIQLRSEEDPVLTVKGVLYPNVTVAFGKYKRTIERNYGAIRVKADQNEIVILPM
ncbi:DUF342 domain-containing protein [Virgibacillus sp. W0181]|uniref:DUF342 domain-containing protein n=1 Tax=Virgibacillus sp. W0181 TaxID=3391581 RepID=UPI003F46466B